MNFTEKPFSDKLEYDVNLLIGNNMRRESATHNLEVAQQRLEQLKAFDSKSLETVPRPLAAERD